MNTMFYVLKNIKYKYFNTYFGIFLYFIYKYSNIIIFYSFFLFCFFIYTKNKI